MKTSATCYYERYEDDEHDDAADRPPHLSAASRTGRLCYTRQHGSDTRPDGSQPQGISHPLVAQPQGSRSSIAPVAAAQSRQPHKAVTAMPTQTEEYLREILEKIQSVRSLCHSKPVQRMSRREKRHIVTELQFIGQRLLLCAPDFKEFCALFCLNQMESWGVPGNLSARSIEEIPMSATLYIFDQNEEKIRNHAFPDTLIQNNILSNLDTHYEQLSNDWYSTAQTPYVLISVTGILAIIRIAMLNEMVGINSNQYYAYSALGAVVLIVALSMLFQSSISKLYISPSNEYQTYFHFFSSSFRAKSVNLRILEIKLQWRKMIRGVLYSMWLIALIVSIAVTQRPPF